MSMAISSASQGFDRRSIGDVKGDAYAPLSQWSNNTSHKVYRAKQALYFAGDAFNGLYQLRSGSAKTSIISSQGQELITQFFLPGDLIGTDGFNQNGYSQNVHFLETSSVSHLSLSELNELLKKSDYFRNNLLNSMSQNLMLEQHMLLNYNYFNSEQRVAQFFLGLSERFERQGCSAIEFRLSMTRTDIANYLGMAIETLCRLLTQFQQSNILCIHNRMIEIKNKHELVQTAGLLEN
jgi:CRP/FNR family transcriptional regulator